MERLSDLGLRANDAPWFVACCHSYARQKQLVDNERTSPPAWDLCRRKNATGATQRTVAERRAQSLGRTRRTERMTRSGNDARRPAASGTG